MLNSKAFWVIALFIIFIVTFLSMSLLAPDTKFLMESLMVLLAVLLIIPGIWLAMPYKPRMHIESAVIATMKTEISLYKFYTNFPDELRFSHKHVEVKDKVVGFVLIAAGFSLLFYLAFIQGNTRPF